VPFRPGPVETDEGTTIDHLGSAREQEIAEMLWLKEGERTHSCAVHVRFTDKKLPVPPIAE